MSDTVRKQKSGDQLAVGDWLAPEELTDDAAEVLFALAYPEKDYTAVRLVVRGQGRVDTYTDIVAGHFMFDLATEAELAELRERAERAQKIADLRSMAGWLEANPDVPMPDQFWGQAQIATRWDGISEADGLAQVRAFAAKHGANLDQHSATSTVAKLEIGSVEYSLLSFHQDGRPADPDPYLGEMHQLADEVRAAADPDPLGQDYGRADTAEPDLTPIGHRIPPHTGAMTKVGMVDETVDLSEFACCGRGVNEEHRNFCPKWVP